ncbi:MAG: hypothetical protein GJT30_07800 [Geobacter sp.]|nr:hypothetical protein [Geobacter sp.]
MYCSLRTPKPKRLRVKQVPVDAVVNSNETLEVVYAKLVKFRYVFIISGVKLLPVYINQEVMHALSTILYNARRVGAGLYFLPIYTEIIDELGSVDVQIGERQVLP